MTKDELLQAKPNTVLEVLSLLQDIEDIYEEVNKETRYRVSPHYHAIKKVHDEAGQKTKGLWEKRNELRKELVILMEKKHIKKAK